MRSVLGTAPPVRLPGYAAVDGRHLAEELAEAPTADELPPERLQHSGQGRRLALLLSAAGLLAATAGVLSTAGSRQSATSLRRPAVDVGALEGKSTVGVTYGQVPVEQTDTQVPVEQTEVPEGCPGSIHVPGYGMVSMINAQWNKPGDPAGKVEVVGGVIPHMKGRSYFGSGCALGEYSYRQYAAIQLLGKRMRYTVDLSAAGCGCNAALYLTSLHQNDKASDCSDYYCDANRVCGVSCAEIDIQEANKMAWYSTLHVLDDGGGQGGGYGAGRRDWDASQYGPGSSCIDTNAPFQVSVAFPVANGTLQAMEVVLTQEGHACTLKSRIQKYAPFGRNGMAELTSALRQGMTPIISYWGVGESMLWLDGKGSDQNGPCDKDAATTCGDTVKFSAFSVEPLPPSQADMSQVPPGVPPAGVLPPQAQGAAAVQVASAAQAAAQAARVQSQRAAEEAQFEAALAAEKARIAQAEAIAEAAAQATQTPAPVPAAPSFEAPPTRSPWAAQATWAATTQPPAWGAPQEAVPVYVPVPVPQPAPPAGQTWGAPAAPSPAPSNWQAVQLNDGSTYYS